MHTRTWFLFLALTTHAHAQASLPVLKLKNSPKVPLDASHCLHPALASFSIETAFFETFFGNITHPNKLSRNLLDNIKTRTGVPAEVRIGGITADSTYWDPNLDVGLFNFIDETGALHNTTIGPTFWDSMNLLPKGTKITMNLNLEDLDYEGALAVARAATGNLDRNQLVAFEIGNEPDHYRRFTPANYSSIWGEWAKNITDELELPSPFFQVAATVEDPLWPFDAPGASSALDCVSALKAGANRDGVVGLCSEHTYQYSVCDSPRIPIATLPNLVNHTRLAMYLDLWQPRIHTVREQLGSHSFLNGEYNSVSCSGKDGVSNTFGQALWLLDTTFYAASLNVSRMYLHQGGPLALQSNDQLNHGGLSFYDMWYPVQNQNGPIKVFPSYATYLFIAETLGHSKSLQIANLYPGRQVNGSSITTAMGDTSAGQLVVYGFWDNQQPSYNGYPTKLALLNLQIHNQTRTGTIPVTRPETIFDITNFLQHPNQSIRVRRLQAPGADVKDSNVTTWAGQHFDSGIAEGRLFEERINGGKVTLKASEAALVFL